jgi:hypothetical protein
MVGLIAVVVAGFREIRVLVQQIEEKGCSPPGREKILEYQSQQDFPICPNPERLQPVRGAAVS